MIFFFYLFKNAACWLLLWLVYDQIIARQKSFIFGRFYLLTSLLIGIIMPLITIKVPVFQVEETSPQAIVPTYLALTAETISKPTVQEAQQVDIISWTICMAYTLGALFFLVKYVINIQKTWALAKDYQRIGDLKVVFFADKVTPYSFWNYVFVNKNEFENGSISPEILLHEQAHIRQRHTLDIMFVEFLGVLFWFSPLLILYRQSIRTNHEFLADNAVLNQIQDKKMYQYLLLQNVVKSNNYLLTSHFNYSITKKRLVMMNKHTPQKAYVWATKIASVTCLVIVAVIFSDLSQAQQTSSLYAPPNEQATTPEGVPNELLKEYQALAEKHVERRMIKNKLAHVFHVVPEKDRARMETIFRSMSLEQQKQQEYVMLPPPRPLPYERPTEEAFESYKNPKVYGVWIDNKKVPNSALNKYKASDFSRVFVSRLLGAALKTAGYKYKFQLDLETNAHYQKNYAEQLADKRYILMLNHDRK